MTHQLRTHNSLGDGSGELTIVADKDKIIDRLQAEEREEVPAQTTDPSYVKIRRADPGLEHLFELGCHGEGQFHYQHQD